jgi:glycosyltransferase involved in cell wall biosynthesis
LSAGAARSVRVIPNGIDTNVFRPDSAARQKARAQLGLGNRFVWIAVGRLMWKKNHRALLEAMTRVAGSDLLIAGTGPEEARLRMTAGPNVRFLGERTDIATLLNVADGFVLSSVIEGLPLALLEAAACGLPCVATAAGGVRETGIGLVVEDAAELAPAMQQIQSVGPAARDRMGREARAIVLERYSIEAVTTQWETLYHTLVAST